jgi:hypothetical protein
MTIKKKKIDEATGLVSNDCVLDLSPLYDAVFGKKGEKSSQEDKGKVIHFPAIGNRKPKAPKD